MSLTRNNTPETVLRIRIITAPRQDRFDEFDVGRFKVGQTYEVPVRLASLLILAGYAESVGGTVAHAEAADLSVPPVPKKAR